MSTIQASLAGAAYCRRWRSAAIALLSPIVAAMAFLLAPQARAQTPSPAPEWQYSVGIPLEKMFEPETPTWAVRIGAAAIYRPRYDGASNYYVLGGPSLDVRYRDLFFASTGEGIGVNLVSTPNWRAGLAISYNIGRREADDHDHLRGMGNINFAPEAKVFVDYVVSKEFPLVIRANIRRAMGGADGWTGDVGAYLPLPGSSEKFYWFVGPTMSFADSRYMNTWFGVSAEQSARSGYAQHNAGAGIKSYGAGLSAMWFFHKHWFVTSDVSVSQLVGSAASSPVVQRATSFSGDMSFNYQF
ncbi:MipA/OmpV family protein [Cupriavidus sp. 2KB_15]|uniref:MipA/OmpV family protein n=1 Tax=Cupriavidus sp. 2KB_15 TaxID=3232976 RepID=UPI003F916D1F